MVFSRYLYSKVVGARTKFISLVLERNELDFLKENGIEHYEKEGRYVVNCDQLKSRFCHC